MLSLPQVIRYSRQLLLPEIGKEGQELLIEAKVLVIGAGGLGCPVLQYLAAAGVGTIGIADGDVVEMSNLQRQVLYTESDIESGKALTAQKRIQAVNPHVQVNVHPFKVDEGNITALVADYDIVVDGTDNFASRYLINDACVLLGKPWVFGSIYRFEGQVSVFNYEGGPGYRSLFPFPPGEDESPDCSMIGVLCSLPGIVGSLQATEVLKIVTGAGNVLGGRLLIIDALNMAIEVVQFSGVPVARH